MVHHQGDIRMTRHPNPNINVLTDDLIDLYTGLLIPFMKVRRDMPFPTEPERDETDGEHAFTLAMLALTINERLHLGLDGGKIAQYALIHDLVEAHAGDVSARASQKELDTKARREHEAYVVIKKRYELAAPWIPRLIEAYEARADNEAKFVYAADKLSGALTRIAGDGSDWSKAFATSDDYLTVVNRLRAKAETFPQLLDLFDRIHDELHERSRQYVEAGK